jgi:hypothetical protein
MTEQRWNRKVITLVAAAAACAVIAGSFALAYPTEVSSSTLGAEWQCHRAVGILTTCSRVSHVVPMNNRSRTRTTEIRRV